MNIQEQLINSTPELVSQGNKGSAAQSTNPIFESPAWTKRGGSLRRRLLATIVPTVLIPLVVASAIGINITRYRAEKDELTKLEQIAILSRETTHKYFQDVLNIKNELEINPLVIEAIKASSQQVQSQGLLNQNIDKLEQEFASTKLVIPNPTLNKYLEAMTKTRGIAEIILTEKNGFNVAYSSPTSDFVQNDEQWWQIGFKEGQKILPSTFDESTKQFVVETVGSLTNPNTGQVFGVAKVSISSAGLNESLGTTVGLGISNSEVVQIIDGQTGNILNTLTSETSTKSEQIIGGEPIAEVAKIFTQAVLTGNPEDAVSKLQQVKGISNVDLRDSQKKADVKLLTLESQGRYFKIAPIPETNFLAVISIEKSEIITTGNQLMIVFASTTFFLGFLAVGNIILLAQTLSQPLTNLTDKAQQVALGDLEVEANFEGTEENRTLAYNFNTLVKRVKELIAEQEAIANQQREEKEKLEQGIYQLLNEIQDAVDGDLTVRASLTSMEMSTVADLFNAVLDSLQDIAVQVRESSSKVSSALGENEQSMQQLAEQTIEEAQKTRNTLASVEQMSQTIAEVATNANQAATLADDAYTVTQEGSKGMDETVNSILSLRTTVGDTAKKMKRLGESSQKISQVVSLIEEIALKTNLLAINASVEASRAGEQGQGFTVVAEQVGALAEQSSAAIKEIAQIVAEIQGETQEVTQAMESGTSQVVNTTRLVESTKQRLEQVLQRSRSINELMRNISQSTVSQAETSRLVTELMQQIAQQSEQRLTSSQQIAQSMQATAQVAQQLESAVEQFKVN